MDLDEVNLQFLNEVLLYHHLPVVVLVAGGATLAHKFHAIVYSFYLESGYSKQALAQMCSEVHACTSDFGVEFSSPQIAPIPVHKVLPWMMRSDDVSELMPEGDFAIIGREAPDLGDDEPSVSFQAALAVPGLLHIVHNAANEMLTVAATLDAHVSSMATVCAWLSDREKNRRFCELCLSTPLGKHLRQYVQSWNHKVYRARWGMVAHAALAL